MNEKKKTSSTPKNSKKINQLIFIIPVAIILLTGLITLGYLIWNQILNEEKLITLTSQEINIDDNSTNETDLTIVDQDFDMGNSATQNGNISVVNGDVTIGSNAVINGEIVVSGGNLSITNSTTVTGNIHVENGDLIIGSNGIFQEITVEGNFTAENSNHFTSIIITGENYNLILNSNNTISGNLTNTNGLISLQNSNVIKGIIEAKDFEEVGNNEYTLKEEQTFESTIEITDLSNAQTYTYQEKDFTTGSLNEKYISLYNAFSFNYPFGYEIFKDSYRTAYSNIEGSILLNVGSIRLESDPILIEGESFTPTIEIEIYKLDNEENLGEFTFERSYHNIISSQELSSTEYDFNITRNIAEIDCSQEPGFDENVIVYQVNNNEIGLHFTILTDHYPQEIIDDLESQVLSIIHTVRYEDSSNIYKVTMEIKNDYDFANGYPDETMSLFNYIKNLVREENLDTEKIVWKTETDNPYQRTGTTDFYTKLNMDIQGVYEDDYATTTITRVNSDLQSYVDDEDYCNIDSDCVIRYNFCNYGAYNKYEPFVDIWGCEGTITDETGYIYGNDYGEPIIDPTLNCQTTVSFSGAECIDHICIGTGREVSCVE